MKVEVISSSEKFLEEHDYRSFLKIKIDGEKKFDVSDGELEDAKLSRDFSSCYNIPTMLKLAYDAGKKGEELEIENIELDIYEWAL